MYAHAILKKQAANIPVTRP